MFDSNDLTKGKITSKLIRLAVPLIATNFIQTAYSLVDMIWIGRLGSDAVVAVGTAGFFINMAFALFALIITGTSIRISQSFGSKNFKKMKQLIINGYLLAIILAIIYSSIIIIYRFKIIDFFNLNDEAIRDMASNYLLVSMFGVILMYFNTLFSSIFNSLGNSRLSFRLNTVGFIVNIVLDPILIFGVGGFLTLGVTGAAFASIIARITVFILSLVKAKKIIGKNNSRLTFDLKIAKDVIILGIPYTIQRVAFIGISIIIAKLISAWGPTGIAVQKIGVQIESISYMTIGGLNGAVVAFIGQNFGANNMKRIKEGYRQSILMSFLFGLLTTALLIIFSKEIFSVFVSDDTAVNMGISYLRIIGISQVFMCLEIVTMASFNGVGKTYVPAIVSLTFTIMRVPLAIYLSSMRNLEVDGIWWSISISSIVKGIILVSLFLLYISRYKSVHSQTIQEE